jgi:hypothetical protein
MMYAVEMGSDAMIYVPSFIKIGTGVKQILKFCLRNLRSRNVCITDGKDFLTTPLIWAQVP